MIVQNADIQTTAAEPQYNGLRLTAEEFFALPDDGFRYELIDGVVCMSPSPKFDHQDIVGEIYAPLRAYVSRLGLGKAVTDTDVVLRQGGPDGDLIYRPDVLFIRADRVAHIVDYPHEAPDVAVEVISPGTRRKDLHTKRRDYERYGVREYWIVDPTNRSMTFLRLREGRFVEVEPESDRYTSEAVPGFVLELDRIRALFPRQVG